MSTSKSSANELEKIQKCAAKIGKLEHYGIPDPY